MTTSGRGPKRLKYLPVKVMAANEASDQGTIRAPIAPGAIPVTRCSSTSHHVDANKHPRHAEVDQHREAQQGIGQQRQWKKASRANRTGGVVQPSHRQHKG
ncbi:Uncharacterised protein [Klebsiella pneumoniae]|uniref:Uncharacterized protein n=1 Tax=Klebsiella pneumoniae TaxID=573 RepID=A0A377TYB0_KLEPN|nr:Uncharacterised protein [Klebsiella pneumoniae]